MAAATIEHFEATDQSEAGWFVTFDEVPCAHDGDWEGPFETQEAAQDYATSILEAAAAEAVKSMFK